MLVLHRLENRTTSQRDGDRAKAFSDRAKPSNPRMQGAEMMRLSFSDMLVLRSRSRGRGPPADHGCAPHDEVQPDRVNGHLSIIDLNSDRPVYPMSLFAAEVVRFLSCYRTSI